MPTKGGSLAPGSVVGDGRYRLLAQFGFDERADAHLWRARDGQLRRDVALTLLVGDPTDTEATGHARRTLERAAHAAQFAHDGVARVLDVLSVGHGISSSEGLLGIVVAEWTKGTDLIDLVADGPIAPSTAARMVQALTEAVERAHQSGLMLGLDHPQRLRVTPNRSLRLAFPGPLPQASLRDDVKAIGGVLYLLLTGTWPLSSGPAAIPTAPRTQHGRIVAPRSLQRRVPAQLSSLTVRTIEDGGNGGIRTSSAILRALDQIAESEERTQYIRYSGEEDESEDRTDPDGGVWTTKKPVRDAARRKKLALGATVLVVAAVGILAWLGMLLINFFQGPPDSGGPPINVARPNSEAGPGGQAAPAGPPVVPADMRVYNPEGKGDSPSRADYTIDGKPETVWRTDDYRQQLPALKSGVGLAASFDQPTNVAAVQIDSASPGTNVEIRAADSPNPLLRDTRVVGAAPLNGPTTEIRLPTAQPAPNLIVWITKLGGGEGSFSSEIADVRFLPAA